MVSTFLCLAVPKDQKEDRWVGIQVKVSWSCCISLNIQGGG